MSQFLTRQQVADYERNGFVSRLRIATMTSTSYDTINPALLCLILAHVSSEWSTWWSCGAIVLFLIWVVGSFLDAWEARLRDQRKAQELRSQLDKLKNPLNGQV